MTAVLVLSVLLFGAACSRSDGAEAVFSLEESAPAESRMAAETQTAVIVVHVCGEVVSPGVYEFAPGARLQDAVEAAGGFTEQAADSYNNLAALLRDGEKVVIPALDDVAQDRLGLEAQEEGGPVNINTADAEELMTLPGIGEARAQAILEYREEHGGFGAVEDIMQVSGIKEAAFEKIRDSITVGP